MFRKLFPSSGEVTLILKQGLSEKFMSQAVASFVVDTAAEFVTKICWETRQGPIPDWGP
jgi:hypothetical protein